MREQQAQLLSRDVLIEQLKLQLARLKKMKFGRSSEQLDAQIAQLELSLEELEANAARAAPPKTPASEAAPSPRASPYRIICPASLMCTSPQQDPATARSAAGRCARWARMHPKCSSMCRSTGR